MEQIEYPLSKQEPITCNSERLRQISPPEREGELVIRTPSVTPDLIGAEHERERRLLDDGCLRTSGVGYLEEGRVFIVGRASETIITGSTHIRPVEIERAFKERTDVREAIVVGVPDAQWRETPAALVHLPRPVETDLDERVRWMCCRLAGFKRPRHMFVSAEPIPRAWDEAKAARGEPTRTLQEWVADPNRIPPHLRKVVE